MRAKDNMRTAAEVLVDQLRIHGVRHVFCVPGESYLAVLDAFHDSELDVTVCRQEGGACMMAEAIGKVTGRPGVCFVTRGPGATNASPGIHIARQDSTPLVMFVGQVGARHARARGVSGTRLSRGVRLDDQMDDRDRRSGAGAGDRLARVLYRGQWAAGSGRRRHSRGHADRARRRRRTRRRSRWSRPRRGPTKWQNSPTCCRPRARRSCCSAAAAGRKRPPTPSARFAQKYSPCRSPPRSAARICSMRCIPATRAISASVPIRS